MSSGWWEDTDRRDLPVRSSEPIKMKIYLVSGHVRALSFNEPRRDDINAALFISASRERPSAAANCRIETIVVC